MPTKMHNDVSRQNDDTKNRQSTQGNQSKTNRQSTPATSKTAHRNMKDEDVDNNSSSRSSRK